MTEPTIAIVDYGAGNVRSVSKAMDKLGYKSLVTSNASQILKAEAVIMPGQGASESAMHSLLMNDLVEPIMEVINKGTPFFGVCLGLQLLLEYSEEGPTPCLGTTKGNVLLLPSSVKRPHMGWNRVSLTYAHPVFAGVENESYFYFVHSYYAAPENRDLVLGTTNYGVEFCSVIAEKNLVATQFHPEKSGTTGLQLNQNFLNAFLGPNSSNRG